MNREAGRALRALLMAVRLDRMGHCRVEQVLALTFRGHHDELAVLLAGELAAVRDEPSTSSTKLEATSPKTSVS